MKLMMQLTNSSMVPSKLVTVLRPNQSLVDVSDMFCSGEGEKEEASKEVAGGSALIENRGRGWGVIRGVGGGAGAEGMSLGKRRGLNFFVFRGRTSH